MEKMTMPSQSPQAIEDKYTTFITAWETHAPTSTLGGLTLAQFKALCKPSQDSRTRLEVLMSQVIGEQETRNQSDTLVRGAMSNIAKSVRADLSVGGDNGALYKAMGFVPVSERKSGLTRK
jgi:hypothetical protein